MPKHTDALPTFDAFRAPWETETGSDSEIDKPKLKRYIYNLVTDKARAQDARDVATDELSTASEELATAQAEVRKASPEEANKKISKLEAQLDEITKERDGLVQAKEYAQLREEVLGDTDKKYAKYVVGETREELEASLKTVLEDFGVSADAQDDDEADEEEDFSLDTQPKALNLRNVVTPKDVKGDFDFDKMAGEILGQSII